MKRSLKQILTSLAAVAVLSTTSFSTAAAKDIVDTAVAAGSFKTLAAALGAADLVSALKGTGPFTVFAPTDEAFAKLPKGAVGELLKPENKDKLTAVLTYHVVAGKVPAADVVKLKGAKTLNGQRVDIAVANGKVKVDKANVVTTDIECSNGIIHVIDSVLLPSSATIVETAGEAGNFNTLLAAAKAAGLAEALSGKGPFTVFAPTDAAFAKLPAGTVESLLKPENKGKLVAVLKYHVVPGRIYSEDALAAKQAKTLQGSKISIAMVNGKAQVNNVGLVATDIDASNGVIHIIDGVLLPPSKEEVSVNDACKMIETVVAHGSRTFNAGHHQACADMYTKAMQRMVAYGDQMPQDIVTNMQQVLTQAAHTQCPTERSWTLRRGLDQAYARMAATR